MLYHISEIGVQDFESVCHLYAKCFEEDAHFKQSGVSFEDGVPDDFRRDILAVLREGRSIGTFANGALVGGLLIFSTNMKHKSPGDYNHIFGIMPEVGVYPYQEEILNKIPDDALYLLAGFVDSEHRGRGLYKGMLERVLLQYPETVMVSDISNLGPMRMYERMGFVCSEIALDYYFIRREGAK